MNSDKKMPVPEKDEDADKTISPANGVKSEEYKFCFSAAAKIKNTAQDSHIFIQSPHKQLIDTICSDILPNIVRLYESNRMGNVLDKDQYVNMIERKVERANKSLRLLNAEEQCAYRIKINQAYAENIDNLHRISGMEKFRSEPKWHPIYSGRKIPPAVRVVRDTAIEPVSGDSSNASRSV